MARFLALYMGSSANDKSEAPDAATEQQGMAARGQWATDHEASIVDQGAPLGKTLKVDGSGVAKTTNLVTGYLVVEADSHEQAAASFKGHPHFAVFSASNSVEIIECLEMPSA